ncbi:MAG: hypothetical protein V4812_13000 [Pseudomonadota bacterium]
MTAGKQAKSVNGYSIQAKTSGDWWICTEQGEDIAGPFSTQEQACEVAAVLQDQRPAPARRPTP